MYFPGEYDPHNESLNRWLPLFNETSPKYITAERESKPGIRDVVIDLLYKKIGMDWQKRSSKHWKEGEKFPFVKLGQFERKFEPYKEIDLTVQCNNEENAFVVAWHGDFGEPEEVDRDTESGELEKGEMRTTKKFKKFMYEEISDFKSWLLKTHHKYDVESLWPIIVEVIHTFPMYPSHTAYTRDQLLFEEPDISAENLSFRLGISLGEAMVILHELGGKAK